MSFPKRWTLALASSLMLLTAGPAWPGALEAVGQIQSVSGSARILRSEGAEEPARPYAYLYAGDSLEVFGPKARVVFVDAGSSARTLTSGRMAVNGAKPAPLVRGAREFFAGFERLFSQRSKPTHVYTHTNRGPPPLLSADPLLPANVEQAFSAGQHRLAPVWRAGVAKVSLRRASGGALLQASSDPYAHVVLPSASLSGRYRLVVSQAGGRDLVWPVTTADNAQAPEPPWMGGAPSRTDPERLTRAAWLLQEPSGRWRLFALSEMAALSERNYAAARLWRAIRAGELSPLAEAAPPEAK